MEPDERWVLLGELAGRSPGQVVEFADHGTA
jgi:hypothetical protein